MSINTSPNMSLPVPVVTQEPGPNYAVDINNCMAIIDSHTHNPGFGVQITPSGLNINSDLTINIHNLLAINSLQFSPTTLSTASSLYVSGVDLYYNDGDGNVIQMTRTGSVNGSTGTITGLPNGNAGAAYSGTPRSFIFTSGTLTPANLDAGSITIRNITASSDGITISAPSGLASNFTLTLPNLPGTRSFMTLDQSGNIASGVAYANGITAAQIANSTITSTQIVPGSIVRESLALSSPVVGQQTAALTTASTSLVYANCSLNYGASGNPLMLMITSDNGALNGSSFISTEITNLSASPFPEQFELVIQENGVTVATWDMGNDFLVANTPIIFPVSFSFLHVAPAVGTNSYAVYARCKSSFSSMTVNGIKLMVYEPAMIAS